MNNRLVRALVFAAVAACVGVAVVNWKHLGYGLEIVLALAAIGFALGLVFKLRVV